MERNYCWQSRKPFAILAISLAIIIIVLATVLTAVLGGGSTTKRFLHIADLHYDSTNRTCWDCDDITKCNVSAAVMPYGTYGAIGCDSNWNLITATTSALQNLPEQPDFVLLCGDLSGHRSESYEQTLSEVTKVHDLMVQTFPDKLIVGVIGNDDVHPDYCSNSSWYGSLFPLWQKSIICTQCYSYDTNNSATWHEGGYYSIWPEKGMKLIVLNTLYYADPFAKRCGGYSPVADTQLNWLAMQLQQATEAGDSVYIAGHVLIGQNPFESPPGHVQQTQLWATKYLRNYTSIVNQYKSVINAQLFAHVHRDEYRMIRSDFVNANSPFTLAAFATSSVSPIFLNNPSFRIYEYDDRSFDLLDYQVYYFDLQGNNVGRADGFQFLYRFSDKWGGVTNSADGPPLGISVMSTLSSAIGNSLVNMSNYRSLRDVMFYLDRYDWACAVQFPDPTLYLQCVVGGRGEL